MRPLKEWTLLLILFTLGIPQGGYGQDSRFCRLAFYEEQALELFIKAEALLKKVTYPNDLDIVPLISSITYKLSAWEQMEELSPAEVQKLRQEVQTLELRLNNSVQIPVTQNRDWATLIEDPTLIQADTTYQVQWPNNHQISVVFTSDIVQAFFTPNSKSPFRGLQQQIAKKQLKAISHGWTSGDSIGIRTLRRTMGKKAPAQSRAHYNKLVEIKVVGKIAGHIRIGGFMDRNVLYIVHYVKDSDHSKNRVPFINHLINKQASFLAQSEH